MKFLSLQSMEEGKWSGKGEIAKGNHLFPSFQQRDWRKKDFKTLYAVCLAYLWLPTPGCLSNLIAFDVYETVSRHLSILKGMARKGGRKQRQGHMISPIMIASLSSRLASINYGCKHNCVLLHFIIKCLPPNTIW